MRRIKFIKDYFVSELICIEQGTEMMLEERKDEFVIWSCIEKCNYRFGYELKDEVYEWFEFID